MIISAGVAALAGSALATATAHADPTIAGAGTIEPGTQQFGNTLCPDTDRETCSNVQFWKLNGTAGDQVTIDWQHGGGDENSYVSELRVYPEGTDDFSINNVNSLFSFYIGANDKAQSVFTLPQTGTFPLQFIAGCCGDDDAGPYDFSTTIERAVKLFISSPHRKAQIRRNTSVVVNVRGAEGAPYDGLTVTLTGVWRGKSRRLGTATSSNGVAKFALRLPRSTRMKTIRLRAFVSGVDRYLDAQSSMVKVKVKG
jgi:hypothetical protein